MFGCAERDRVDQRNFAIDTYLPTQNDTKAGHFASSQGYVCVGVPPRGGDVRFGSYIARYIGWG
jgi:hypothetical protein